MSGFTKIPNAVFEARQAQPAAITGEQLHILIFCYAFADRSENFRVRSYSAERVLKFWDVAVTEANLRRYQRARLGLLAIGVIKSDYHRLDPRRSKQTERTYSIWLPAPSRFERIGTKAENLANLWSGALPSEESESSLYVVGNVGLVESDDVGLPIDVTDEVTGTYDGEQSDNVGLKQCDKCDYISENQDRESPLPPKGVPPLPSPPGMRSSGAGLKRQTPLAARAAGKETQSDEQQQKLKDAALRYSDFSSHFWHFVPNVEHVMVILQRFLPEELILAQATHFPLGEKYSTKEMTHFFAKSAITLIQSGRLKNTSYVSARLVEIFGPKNELKQFPDYYAGEVQGFEIMKTACKPVFQVSAPDMQIAEESK